MKVYVISYKEPAKHGRLLEICADFSKAATYANGKLLFEMTKEYGGESKLYGMVSIDIRNTSRIFAEAYVYEKKTGKQVFSFIVEERPVR